MKDDRWRQKEEPLGAEARIGGGGGVVELGVGVSLRVYRMDPTVGIKVKDRRSGIERCHGGGRRTDWVVCPSGRLTIIAGCERGRRLDSGYLWWWGGGGECTDPNPTRVNSSKSTMSTSRRSLADRNSAQTDRQGA